jgi:hypothetical protein
MASDEATTTDYTLADGGRVRVYAHGGVDHLDDDGEWQSIATTPEACADLARIAQQAADNTRSGHVVLPRVASREARAAAVYKYDERIKQTGSSERR